jgi:hypothetical protein
MCANFSMDLEICMFAKFGTTFAKFGELFGKFGELCAKFCKHLRSLC